MSSKIPKSLRTLFKQSHQKIRKWLQFDPEFEHFLPKHHANYRGITPGSQAQAVVPKIRDIDQYYDTPHDTDVTYNDEGYRRDFAVVYRYQMLENPVKLLPGQPVGPFFDMGKPVDAAAGDVEYRPQVYTYRRKKVNRVLEKQIDAIKQAAIEGRDRIIKELMESSTETQTQRIQDEKDRFAQQSMDQKRIAAEKRRQRRKSRVLIAEQPDASRILARIPVNTQESV